MQVPSGDNWKKGNPERLEMELIKHSDTEFVQVSNTGFVCLVCGNTITIYPGASFGAMYPITAHNEFHKKLAKDSDILDSATTLILHVTDEKRRWRWFR